MKMTNDGRFKAAKQPRKHQPKANPAPVPPPIPRPGGKLGNILDRVEAKNGATAEELVTATGWQRHSVLAALSRLKARGFEIRLDAKADRKAYRLATKG